jgi:hypothetical protein
MSVTDYRDDIEIPDAIAAELESCRRLVAAPKADKAAMFERGATSVFRVADKDEPKIWRAAVDGLYDIAICAGLLDDDATQAILDRAVTNSGNTPWLTDPTYGGMSPAAAETSWRAAQRQRSIEDDPVWLDAEPPEQPATTGKALVRFPLVKLGNIQLDRNKRRDLVKGLLPTSGLIVIWGPPKCGKSFWTMDLALHVSLGWEYRGRRVQQATVVYVALEGRNGLPARFEAFKKHYGIQDADFYLQTTALNLAKDHGALIHSIEQQLRGIRPGLVVIDTLNRSLVGSESKDEDMAAYLAGADKVEQHFSCVVAIVHHCGIDGTRPRGHTSLSGAVEVQIAVGRGAQPSEIVATVELAKDMPEGDEFYSVLETVDLGTDADGDLLSSRIVLPATSVAKPKPTQRLSNRQRLAIDALDECIATAGEGAPAAYGLPTGVRVTTTDAWRNECYARNAVDRDGRNPRTDFKRLREALQTRGIIGARDNHVWKG